NPPSPKLQRGRRATYKCDIAFIQHQASSIEYLSLPDRAMTRSKSRPLKNQNVKYRYYICDVFTETRFGGNQLAVLPKADGLSAEQMQQIAREFNFSETTFVFPPKAGHTRHVRIFTPAREIPFAGHPNVGTAFLLASTGAFGEI